MKLDQNEIEALKSLLSNPENRKLPALKRLNKKLNFDRVFLWELPPIKNVTFAMMSDSNSTIQMTGYVDKRPVNIKSWKQNKIRKFTFKSDSAGRILKGFDITDSVIGGEIFITGEILDNNNVEKDLEETF